MGVRRGAGCGLQPIPARGRRLRGRPPRAGRVLVVLAHAADHDPVLFDVDLDRPVAGPVLGVDWVVLDGGVKPQPIALLAVVEGALERAHVAPGACPRATSQRAPSAPAATASARAGRLRSRLVLLLARRGLLLLRFGERALGLDFRGLELGRDERVVLGAQVDLVGVLGGDRALRRALVADDLVLALELLDLAHAHIELMGHPRVGTALPYPRADLIEVRA